MKKTLVVYFSALCLISQLLSPIQKAIASFNEQGAQTFLLNAQSSGSPWVTMALAATNAPGINFDYLKNIFGSSSINFEAPILAITALGQDPTKFGSQDYIAELKSFYNSGQIGDPATLNDDYFGILALVSAGLPTSDTIINGSKTFILSHQNSDGGWSWSTSATSDSNDTAVAIMSLVAAEINAGQNQNESVTLFLPPGYASSSGKKSGS